jgi:hypothetical protein
MAASTTTSTAPVTGLATDALFILGTWSTVQALKPRYPIYYKKVTPAEKPAAP